MKIKVYGGTTTENICLKCSNLREIQGVRESDAIRNCAALGDKRIPFPVARCSYYRERDPDLTRYRDALSLNFNRQTGKLYVIERDGFFSSKILSVEEYRASFDQQTQEKTSGAVN